MIYLVVFYVEFYPKPCLLCESHFPYYVIWLSSTNECYLLMPLKQRVNRLLFEGVTVDMDISIIIFLTSKTYWAMSSLSRPFWNMDNIHLRLKWIMYLVETLVLQKPFSSFLIYEKLGAKKVHIWYLFLKQLKHNCKLIKKTWRTIVQNCVTLTYYTIAV